MMTSNCFIYNCFKKIGLEEKAKSTRLSFLGFVRHTFEGIISQGSALWELKSELIVYLGKQEGKAAFEAWLSSEEFGSSRYIAKAAMEISAWYNTLPSKVQRLVVKNCHRWSVAALRELPKLTVDMVTELVVSRKKHTAQSIRDAVAAAANMSDEEWEALAERYDLSESDLCSVKQQALQFALADTPEDATSFIVRRGHAIKALEHLGWKIGPNYGHKSSNSCSNNSSNNSSTHSSSSNSLSSNRGRKRKIAIATYNLSEEDERKLTQLAEMRGVTPNEVISQLLAAAPEYQLKEEKEEEPTKEEPTVAQIEQEYREQIAALEKQLAETVAELEALKQQMATAQTNKTNEIIEMRSPTAPQKLLEKTIKEIETITPRIARGMDVRSILEDARESILFLVRRLLKDLKETKSKVVSQYSYSWNEDFAIEYSQEVDNWEPA
ncbi:MAG: hypothetical protein N3E45_04745 [Oscillatoriaceae bacterium SKW80]|nr:hypothetical protein [Oscillatoriaceae bacterium SKYG93]MCX8120125.1 hypothetical protein [Oscillatoriaceae bacterium SKW80]MDW8453051.1 hypothetical protein [Oscillatoriaceae cyanobacterium SKYGB_i_bin93]